MAGERRMGSADSKNRTRFLDAAELLLLEGGYPAVTSRRVAERAGLKPQLVHYYFRTMEELFLEVFRRRAEEGLRVQEELLLSEQPLRALWEFSIDPQGTAFTMEFMSLANRLPTIRSEMAGYAERLRLAQTETLEKVLDRAGLPKDEFPPTALSAILTSLARMVIMERALGMSTGHVETFALVEEALRQIEGGDRLATLLHDAPHRPPVSQ